MVWLPGLVGSGVSGVLFFAVGVVWLPRLVAAVVAGQAESDAIQPEKLDENVVQVCLAPLHRCLAEKWDQSFVVLSGHGGAFWCGREPRQGPFLVYVTPFLPKLRSCAT